MTDIKTSFSFSIGGESGGNSVSAEIDNRAAMDGGDNDSRLGKTSNFAPAEKIGFLVYYPPDVLDVDYIKTTLDSHGGSVEKVRIESIAVEETVKFAQRGASVTLSKPAIAGSLSVQVVGQSPDGAPVLDSDGVTLKLPDVPEADKVNATDSEAGKAAKLKAILAPSTYKIKYQTRAVLYRVGLPNRAVFLEFGQPEWPVDVYIYMKEL